MRVYRSLLFLVLILASLSAAAQSSAELKRRKDAISREIEQLNKSLTKTASSKKLTLKQVQLITAQIRLREKKINTINSEIHTLDNQISDNTNTVRSLQQQLVKLKKEYAAMIQFAFRNKSAYNKLMFVFAASDFNQAYKRLKYLQQFSEYRKKQVKYIEETQTDLNFKIIELGNNKKQKSNLLSDQQKEKANLGKTKNTQTQMISKLSTQEKNLKQELAQKNAEASRLNRAIQAAITREIAEEKKRAEAAAKAAGTTVKPGSSYLAATPEAAKLSADFLGNRGRLPWPVANGQVIEGFGVHKYGTVTTENNGVDIRTNEGAAVRVVFSGEVMLVQNIGSYYAVVIRHGEYFTAYSYLRSVSVSRGQKVTTKQTIGSAYTDPADGVAKVHFEVHKVTTAMNPESWLANN